MTPKRLFSAGGAIALVFVGFWIFGTRFTEWRETAKAPASPTATATVVPPPATPSTAAATAPVEAPALKSRVADLPEPPAAASPADPRRPGPVNPRYARKPRDFIVEFEVIDGLAVAYGDTILGKPPADFDQTRGLTEIDRPQLWLRGEIPYVVQPDAPNPDRIQAAIQMFHERTGLKFVSRTDQPDAIVFTRTDEHCSSYLGRTGGLQPIFISEQCAAVDIAHELMHALGFVHEQSRTDRDLHLDVKWDNIEPKYQSQYAMVPEALMEVYGGSPFDPQSILMYGRHAFAVRKQEPTMVMKNGNPIHETPKGLSDMDIERVNRLYRE